MFYPFPRTLAIEFLLFAAVLSLLSAKPNQHGKRWTENWLSAYDPISFANPEKTRVKHMDLKWNLDFTRKVISGSVEYEVFVEIPEEYILILDTKELLINSVTNLNGDPLPFQLGEVVQSFGQPLKINISSLTKNSQNGRFKIIYETVPESYALKWLEKEQTKGKERPYVFSNCQPIYCRTILPCQDTPANKATYSAEITVPNGMQVLMSAVILNETLDTTTASDGLQTFRFVQNIPIPSYLIAIAVGNIVGKQVSPRVTIWSEREILDAAVYEFMETEKYLTTAEKLFGEYAWEVYDILVMPPSFILAGMENPCLTFITETILAGDRSLVYNINHEMVHSWFGNLVTNINYEHFWLNEGLAVFAERKVLSLTHGEDYRQLLSIKGLKDLTYSIDNMKFDSEWTKLVPELALSNPNQIMNDIPYQKGYIFVYYLEEKVGGDSFLMFLRDYLSKHRLKSIDSDDFKDDFISYFTNMGKSREIADIDWDTWLYSPGMPPVIPTYHTKLYDAPRKLASQWINWNGDGEPPFRKKDFDNFSAFQRMEFLNQLLSKPGGLSVDKLKAMQSMYNLNSTINHEIKLRWLRLGIISKWIDQLSPTLQFVAEQGSKRTNTILYRDLYNWEGVVRTQTLEHFLNNRHKMMPEASNEIARILNLS